MEAFTFILFAFSFIGIAGLFSLKSWEEYKKTVIAKGLRKRADVAAIQLKQLLILGLGEFEKLVPTAMRLARISLHELALSFAALSRASERQAHRLADMVSHKRHFEHREQKNEFLRQVGAVKSVRADKMDAGAVEA